MSRHVLSVSLAILAVATTVAAEPHPFTVHDLVAMERISDHQASPDGRRVAFVVSTPDLAANKNRHDVWLASLDGGEPRRLTHDDAADTSPRWLDADRLLFLSTRSGSSQLWLLPLSGGEARQLTSLPLDVEAFLPAPAGDALFVALKVFPDCADAIPCTVERLAAEAARKSSGLTFDRLMVRHWDSFVDGRRSHVVRVPLADGQATTPVDLMPGLDADCPTRPFGGDEDFAVSPDGRWLVYTAKVVAGSEEAWSTNDDLWVVPADGSAPPRNLTAANPARDSQPVFSPDGSRLAWLAMQRPGYEADRYRVTVMDWPGGAPKVLTESWDRSPESLAWAADGSALVVAAGNVGNTSIFRVDAATGLATVVVFKHTNSGPAPLPDGSILFARDHLRAPAELFVLAAGASEPRQLTDLNRQRLAELKFGNYVQPPPFKGAHGDEVSYYLVYPVGFDPAKKYPLALLIHGGPQGSFDDHWHYRWNPQIYAAHGYATVMVDFHGSTGYGQAFTDAINGDWGGAPYEDLMKGLDHVLFTNPWIDATRLTAAGASYGGFMVNWIQGHTDRFAALVCHDGNLDERMAYFDTEELWFPEWEHGGTPWDKPTDYAEANPIDHVANWKTPTLVVHGGRDYRVVDTQGLSTFTALQRRGIPSRLLYFPDENHWVLKPQNSIQWHTEVLAWLDRFTAVE